MIDHLFGRPNPSWKRLQVFLVIFFWLWRILYGNPGGPRILWLRKINRALRRFTPWQLIVSTLTGVYAARNLDKILGFGAPEPLADLYSPSYYRATWISTGLDAGFATAMSIRPKWLRDICSVLFSVYYVIYATEADEKLRRFRAVPTVEMLRTTWEKTGNRFLRALSFYPPIAIRRKILLPRPIDSSYQRPIAAWLFFSSSKEQLSQATELILDFPGGGFVSMTPEHHEDRLRAWAIRTGKPVLSIDYSKAPEYPYPYAIDECFDVYRVLVESGGSLIGMSGRTMKTIFSGDSAGAHIAVSVMIKILETQLSVPRPLALVLNYAALDFNFHSWMSPENLRVLRSEQSSGFIPGLAEQKDHFGPISPLSMVGDRTLRRRSSWRDTLRNLTKSPVNGKPSLRSHPSASAVKPAGLGIKISRKRLQDTADTTGSAVNDDASVNPGLGEDKPMQPKVRFNPHISEVELHKRPSATSSDAESQEEAPLGTRLAMTSRTGYFQDRIISPSMMRAMAILYIGPHRNPDFASDYYLSPILAPNHLLAQFPLLLMSCGEKDPFVDDTVIFAGRIREAKRARRQELDTLLGGADLKPAGSPKANGTSCNGGTGEYFDEETLSEMRRERDELSGQGDEDWVQMQIFSDWSHGYLQMPALMHEARKVIMDLADWIDEMFAARSPTANGVNGSASEMAEGADDGDALAISAKSPSSLSSRAVSPPHSASPMRLGRTDAYVAEGAQNGRYNRRDPDDVERTRQSTVTPASDGPSSHHEPGSRETMSGHDTPIRGTGSPGHPSRVGTPGKARQTITESELMRRRRLLDAHLISTDSVR